MIVKVWENTTDKFEVVETNNSDVFMLSGYNVCLASKDCIYLCLPEDIERVTKKICILMNMIKG